MLSTVFAVYVNLLQIFLLFFFLFSFIIVKTIIKTSFAIPPQAISKFAASRCQLFGIMQYVKSAQGWTSEAWLNQVVPLQNWFLQISALSKSHKKDFNLSVKV